MSHNPEAPDTRLNQDEPREFSLEQIKEFIDKYFKQEPETGNDLQKALEQPERQQIRELVKNPFRLERLCATWPRWQRQGSLPKTRAELYRSFVDYKHEYNHQKFRTSKGLPELEQVCSRGIG